jgi:membrane-bound ClpP family serine protease
LVFAPFCAWPTAIFAQKSTTTKTQLTKALAMEKELENCNVDSPYETPEATLELHPPINYPAVRTFLALVAFTAILFITNAEELDEYGVIGLSLSSIVFGLILLTLLKLVAIPCAAFVSMRSGLVFKHAYYKTLGLIYYVPYALFIIVVFFFVANFLVNT